MEIIVQIFRSAKQIEAITKTRILSKAYLSHAQLQEYLKLSQESAILEKTLENKCRITEKGTNTGKLSSSQLLNMIRPEAFDKFLAEIHNTVEKADNANKKKAEDNLKVLADIYDRKVTKRTARNITLAQQCCGICDEIGLRLQTILADIHKSLFNIQSAD